MSESQNPTPEAATLEEGHELLLDFNKLQAVAQCGEPVIPVVVQHARTLEVLILAYANKEALEKSIELGQAVFYSTSRRALWHKGATSGDYLKLEEIRVNCEQNSLLFLVEPVQSGVCHTRGPDGRTRRSCYYRTLKDGLLQFRDEASDR